MNTRFLHFCAQNSFFWLLCGHKVYIMYRMTEDTLNIEEIKMQNKTVSKILVAIIMTSMLIAILPALPVAATTLTSINPTSGNVGTTVTVIGTIDTLGGAYSIEFDGAVIESGNAPPNSYEVNDTFNVPATLGSDAGLAHTVGLRDTQTANVQTTTFNVITSRTLEIVPAYAQEGDSVALTVAVTGGTLANTLNSFDIEVTGPDGTAYTGEVSFTSDTTGSGSNTSVLFPDDFSAGANTDLTGTYSVVADRTLPGVITDWASTSFDIGIVDAVSYARFETVNVQTDGWANNQNVTITITDPSDAVAFEWVDVNTTSGTSIIGSWIIPWNAPLGTYTITAVNATGDNKAVDSTQTFTVGSANLAVTFVDDPMANYQRTETVHANFTIMYPDATFLNGSQLSSIEVRVYYNTTMVDSITLTQDDYDSATDNWAVSWKIPRNATLGSNFKFHLDVDTIADTNDNMGPTAATPSGSFTVEQADLAVMITQQPADNYTRTGDAMAKINITYPDNTFYTDADLGEILVRVYLETSPNLNVANVTLMPEDFNASTNDWTIIWNSPYNATLGQYFFEIMENEIYDAANPNMGPVSLLYTDYFNLTIVDIVVDAIMTDAETYAPGEYVSVFFDAMYADGTPVTTANPTIWLTAPDTYTMTSYQPQHTVDGRYAITLWLSDAQAQVGAWTITLQAMSLTDDASNMGPSEDVTTNFTVTPAEVTLDSLMAALQDLSDRVDGIEADTNGLGSSVTSLQSSVSALQSSIVSIAELVADLQTQVDSLSATAATDADVAAVSTAVSGLSSDLSALETKLNAVSTAVNNAATDADVAAVQSALQASIDDLAADVAALETTMNALSTSVGTDLDTTANDLSNQIGGLNTMVIVAIVLALIAAISAILAVYIIQRKIAG
jgi:prefoldin subunit 5